MTWDEAKKQLDLMDFPQEDTGWKDTDRIERHTKKKIVHNLITSSKYLDTIDGYEVAAKYNFCKECGDIRNKALFMYNNEDGLVHEKWFVYHGKDVTGKDIRQVIKDVFNNIGMVLIFAL